MSAKRTLTATLQASIQMDSLIASIDIDMSIIPAHVDVTDECR